MLKGNQMQIIEAWIRAGAATCAIFGVTMLFGASNPVTADHRKWPPQVDTWMIRLMHTQQQQPAAGDDVMADNLIQDPTFLQWAIREGGAYVVILVILFFYRRDWKTATDFWKDQHKITTDLAKECSKAMTDQTAALRENTIVTHGLKNLLQYQGPQERRGGSGIPNIPA